MSTLKTTNIAHPSSASNNIVLDSSGRALVGLSSANANGGILQLSSGITFPATQVLSTDPNTLDDYEEGTWTPTLLSGSCTGTCYYTKTGRVVNAFGEIFHATNGSGGIGVSITNFPFVAAVMVRGFAGYSGISLDGADKQAAIQINNSTAIGVFHSYPAGSGIDADRWLSGANLNFNITYITT